MNRENMNIINDNKSSSIEQRSPCLQDDSNQIFDITKEFQEDRNDNQNNKIEKKSLKVLNHNRLNKDSFLYNASSESSSIEPNMSSLLHYRTNELPQSVIDHNTTSIQLLTKDDQRVKQENMMDRFKTDVIDETLVHNNVLVLINIHPDMRTNFHQRRKRSFVVPALILIPLAIILAIIVYIIIIIVKTVPRMNSISFYKHPRL
ncbi:unnamed protein product [Rotaria sordida]|uniref:Uncharacterized protein n=1 Tax=Rotaria sordida TaxID=392033 RepID=A0A813VM10_9BILA|nr:unnamed protein product [Rotaria sordida]